MEKGQYLMAFGVIGVLLWVAGFPVFLLFFASILSFFVWKVFSSEGRNDTRRIFEFYLSANEILRDDERRWYGFEIQESIGRGESIVKSMSAPPPLVHYALGALYQKIGDHSSAVKNLSLVADESDPVESAIVFPTNELREYVRMLRKIERSPAEAPLTSSAIRSLERARKNRSRVLLENSRVVLSRTVIALPHSEQKLESVVDSPHFSQPGSHDEPVRVSFNESQEPLPKSPLCFVANNERRPPGSRRPQPPNGNRKTISEVLHDIYDKNVS